MTLVMYMKKGARENKVIKLVYDFYENELGIVYDADHEVEVSVDSVLSQLPTKNCFEKSRARAQCFAKQIVSF